MKQQEINKLLEAFFNGTISPEDRRRLDLHALNDPFLFEAMEGGKAQNISSMDSLRTRLQQRVKPSKRRVLWMPTVAACFLLISAVFLWNYYGDIDSVEMADTIEVDKHGKTLDESPAIEKSAENEEVIAEVSQGSSYELNSPKIKKTKQVTIDSPPKTSVEKPEEQDIVETMPIENDEEQEEVSMQGDLNTEYNPERNEMLDDVAEEKITPPPTVENEIGAATSQDVKNKDDMAFIQKERKKTTQARMSTSNSDSAISSIREITGIVTDELGEPIIGANIYSDENLAGVNTDFDGKFLFRANPTINTFEVNYVGYESKKVLLTDENYYEIKLEENTQELEEVIVSGYGNSSAAPDMGWKEFNDYIKKNNKIIDEDSKGNLSGVVRLQFFVYDNGKPTDFKILDTPSTELGQRAIQLIINSGKWSQGEVVYEITFD